jgi:hypothetical protein
LARSGHKTDLVCGPLSEATGPPARHRPDLAGKVAQLFLRPGMMTVSSPAMIFIHHDDKAFSAAFPQTVVQRLRRGAEAEIAFDADRLAEMLGAGSLEIRYRKHRDRYGRRLARLTVNGWMVGETLIQERLAVRYRGYGPKMDWCSRTRR